MIQKQGKANSLNSQTDGRQRQWLPAGIAVLCVALISSGAWLYYRAERGRILSMVDAQLGAVADLKSAQILNWRNERLADARFFSQASFVSRDVQAVLSNLDDESTLEDTLYWLTLLKGGDRYEQVTLFDAELNPRLGVPKPTSAPDPLLRERLAAAFRTKGIVMTDLYRSGQAGAIHLDILFPVFAPDLPANATNAPIAMVLMRINPNQFLYPLAQAWPLPSPTGEIVLIRRDGDEVMFLNELRHRTNAAFELKVPVGRSDRPTTRAVQGETGVIEGADYRGVPVLAAFRNIPGSPWFLGAKVDQAEVFAPLRNQATNVGLAALALTLAALLGLGWFWREREARFLRSELVAKEAMDEQEFHFRSLIEQASDVITILGEDGFVEYQSPSITRMLGYAPGELLNQQILEYVHPDNRAHVVEALRIAVEPPYPIRSEVLRFRHKDGTWRVLESVGRLLSADAAGRRRIVINSRDISDRMLAEEAMLESAHQVREAQRIARLGSYALDVSRGRWTSSPILDEVFGLTDSTFTKDVEGWLQMVHPTQRDEMRRYFEEDVLARHQQFDREYRIVRLNDGEERWVHGMGELVLNDLGEPVKLIGTIQDITDRRKTELALESSEAELSAIYQHAPVMMLLVDQDHRVHRANRAALAFLDLGDLPPDVIPQGDLLGCVHALGTSNGCGHEPHCAACTLRASILNTFQSGISHDQVEIRSKVVRQRQTQDLAMLASTARLFVGGNPMVLVCLEDITEQRRLEEQFRQSQKMEAVGQLAGGVAHDFNNILAAMLMHLQLLQESSNLPPEVAASLKELESGADRAASLTRQLLVFSRRQAMQTRRLDVNQVISGLMKMLRRLLGEHIRIVLDSDAEPLWVEADAGMLEQVAMNLCVNARDAMPKGGQLTLSTNLAELDSSEAHRHADARVGQFVRITVADNGCGMDEHTLHRMFEPFFTTKQSGRGTGLGLATVYGIVRQHHGWVEVNSSVGMGTTFHVYLPVAAENPDPETSVCIPRARGGNETILLVEDDDSVRGMVGRTLNSYGYEVLEASNGREAIRIWETQKPRVKMLFTDMVMPGGLTGVELAEQLRHSRPDLKIMITSGYSSDLLRHGGRPPAGMDFLPKPYNTQELARVVRTCLDSQS